MTAQSRLCSHVPGRRQGAVQKLLFVLSLPESQLERYYQSQAQLIRAFHYFVFPVRFALPEPVAGVEGFPWTGSFGAQALAFAPSASPDQKTSASTWGYRLLRIWWCTLVSTSRRRPFKHTIPDIFQDEPIDT